MKIERQTLHLDGHQQIETLSKPPDYISISNIDVTSYNCLPQQLTQSIIIVRYSSNFQATRILYQMKMGPSGT